MFLLSYLIHLFLNRTDFGPNYAALDIRLAHKKNYPKTTEQIKIIWTLA
jgi:hypothetical protein